MIERSVEQIERDILEAAENGTVSFFDPNDAWDRLTLLYAYELHLQARVIGIIDYLVLERYLSPIVDREGKTLSARARGITPRGHRRLQKLRHPIRTWIWKNWFPLAVAVVTALVGISSIFVDIFL